MVPLSATHYADDNGLSALHYLERRRGGGGGGRGGGGGKSSGGKSGGGNSGGSSSSGGKSGGKSGSKGSRGTAAGAFAFGAGAGVGCSSCSVYPYAWGGGHARPIHSNVPFAGRLSGGGTRDQVFGTSRYGSGYPYGASGDVSGRPFPFAFWPIPVAVGYFGADTYINYADNIRPGGDIKVLEIKFNLTTTNETYHLVGDRSSLPPVLDALREDCGVLNSTLGDFDPRSSDPTRVVQWYRASSFALALDSYSNLASTAANMSLSSGPLPTSMDTPLPQGLNSTFLQCINATIGASVPLLAPPKTGLSGGAIAGIVLGSIFGAILLISLLWAFLPCLPRMRRRRRVRDEQKRIAQANLAAYEARKLPTPHQPAVDVEKAGNQDSKFGVAFVGRLPGMKRKSMKEMTNEKAQKEGSSEGLMQMPQPQTSEPTTAMPTPELAPVDKQLGGTSAVPPPPSPTMPQPSITAPQKS